MNHVDINEFMDVIDKRLKEQNADSDKTSGENDEVAVHKDSKCEIEKAKKK